MSDDARRSVAFDRAASFYDASRDTESDDTRREAALVVSELAGRERVVEIGTGTGAMGLRLHQAGHHLVAIDLSMPMLRRLVDRAGGAAEFGLVQADATRMPFADDVFDAAVARWVLHLIPNWSNAVEEIARVLRDGSIFVVNTGGSFQGPWGQVRARFGEEIGSELRPVGLYWRDFDSLDRVARRCGFEPRELPPLRIRQSGTLQDFIRGIERNHYSWTWSISERERLRAVGLVRAWAEERFGPLDRPTEMEIDSVWRAYDLRGDRRPSPRTP